MGQVDLARAGWSCLLICACLLTFGCHVVYRERSDVLADAARTVVGEPIHFALHKNDYLCRLRNKLLARRAWADTLAAEPSLGHSKDYGRGFRDGFADFLYAGGSGEPPLLPPRSYWKVGYETPRGRRAIEDYFAGFRHGALASRTSGIREFTTVLSSLRSMVDAGTFDEIPSETDSAEELLPPPVD